MIAVVDYGRGNIYSIGQALNRIGAEFSVTDNAAAIADADRIVLPGVGAFGDAMAGLERRGLIGPLKAAAEKGTPLLGICLGMQMLADASEEFGEHAGLGLIPGRVRKLDRSAARETRIPNVGWRRLSPKPGDRLMDGLTPGAMVYFVHSYVPTPDDATDIAATIDFAGRPVAAVIRRDNVIGYQFHPEKSGDVGLGLLKRFVEFVA